MGPSSRGKCSVVDTLDDLTVCPKRRAEAIGQGNPVLKHITRPVARFDSVRQRHQGKLRRSEAKAAKLEAKQHKYNAKTVKLEATFTRI